MSDWVETTDPKSGRVYYYNRITKKTQWTKPEEMGGADSAPAQAAASSAAASSGSSDDPESVAANWGEVTDPKSGRVYYYNKVTKKTSWAKPAALEQSSNASYATPAAAAAQPIQQQSQYQSPVAAASSEWSEAKDPNSGRSYWYNRTTKETTWKNPNAQAAEPVMQQQQPAAANNNGYGASAGAGSSSAGGNEEYSGFNMSGYSGSSGGGYSTITAVKSSAQVSATQLFQQEAADESADDKKGADIRHLLRDENSDDEDGKDDGDNAVKRRDVRQDEEEDDDDESHEFVFTKHRKGWWKRALRIGQHHDTAQLLSFKKSLIHKALLKLNRDLDEEAVQCFKNIMSYMGDRKSSKPPIEHAKKMLRNLMIAPAGLRDEVYMQLCKQTTANPSMDSSTKGWELMSFSLATFPPSKHLKTFLLDYIKKNSEDNSKPKLQAFAQLCFERLPTIMTLGQRKQVPSTLELQCLMESKTIPIRVNLANGAFKTFTVDPYTSVKDVEDMLVKKYSLAVTTPFALYEAAEANVERILDPKDRVLDIVASWENPPLVEEIKLDMKKEKIKSYEKLPKNQIKVTQKEAKYNSLLYKAKLVLKTTNQELMSDPEAVNLIYIQATQDVVTQRYPSNDKDITVLAALQLQATFGDYKKDTHIPGWLKPKIAEFMPQNLIEKKGKLNDSLVAEWEQKILAKYMKVSGFTSLEAKLNYLDYVQEWVFYGSTFFLVEQRQFKDYPSPLTLGINCEGVLLMHPEKKTVLENYQYTDIVTWGHSDEKFIVVVGNIVQQRKLIFKTDGGKSMNHLIHDYVKFKVKNKEAQAQALAAAQMQ